jgi:dihydroorotase-like cyclic amidohydrolase
MMRRTFVVPVLLFALLGSGYSQRADFDILIRNGRVVDGTGNPSFIGDVGIRDGKIAAIGRLANRTAARTPTLIVDANGLVVAPGFIDIHNHSDDTVIEDGDAQSMVRQGSTQLDYLAKGGYIFGCTGRIGRVGRARK